MLNNIEPSVLIILPVHNEAKYIERALDSVLKQSFTNWKVYCQDNASEDQTFEIVSRYSNRDSRIKIQRISEKLNAAESFLSAANWALQSESSQFVTWFSGDDFWVGEDFLGTLLDVLRSSVNIQKTITVPEFLLQSEEKPSNFSVLKIELNDKKINKRLRKFIKSWLNVCVMYGLYHRAEFEKLVYSEESRFSAYLGSDWWWSYFAVKDCEIISTDVRFRKTHHEEGWRHDASTIKVSDNFLQKTLIFLETRVKFLWKHFILEKKRYRLLQDFWVTLFALSYFFATISDLSKTAYLFLSKSRRMKNKSA